jgi:uncharacterized membrane protein (UPF0136 family)
MIELIDNLSQFLLTLLATIGAGISFYKNRSQVNLLLTCFFASFMLGTLYWTLHYLLFDYTPQIFYVSELAWLASHLFLLTLAHSLASPDERDFRHPLVYLVPLFCLPQLILYLSYGDILFNILICGLAMAVMWYAVRGFLYAREQTGKSRDMQYFHLALIIIIFLEFSLWTASCFWVSDSYTNPYFWIDFLLTLALINLLPATRRAVGL